MINFQPAMDSLLWARKCQQTFICREDLRRHVADQRTRISRFIGKPEHVYSFHDVLLTDRKDHDALTGWKNYCTVVLDGTVVGYCGE